METKAALAAMGMTEPEVTILMALLAALALAGWTLPAGVDPEVAEIVERVVEDRGGMDLAAPIVADLVGEPVPARGGRAARLLPTLVLRLTLAVPSGGRGLGWDVVFLLAWPLG